MGKKLFETEVARYERDGLLFPVDAFTADEARRYRESLEAFERRDGREFGKGHNLKPHLLFRLVDEIVHSPAVLDAVEDLIGPDIRGPRMRKTQPLSAGIRTRPISVSSPRCR